MTSVPTATTLADLVTQMSSQAMMPLRALAGVSPFDMVPTKTGDLPYRRIAGFFPVVRTLSIKGEDGQVKERVTNASIGAIVVCTHRTSFTGHLTAPFTTGEDASLVQLTVKGKSVLTNLSKVFPAKAAGSNDEMSWSEVLGPQHWLEQYANILPPSCYIYAVFIRKHAEDFVVIGDSYALALYAALCGWPGYVYTGVPTVFLPQGTTWKLEYLEEKIEVASNAGPYMKTLIMFKDQLPDDYVIDPNKDVALYFGQSLGFRPYQLKKRALVCRDFSSACVFVYWASSSSHVILSGESQTLTKDAQALINSNGNDWYHKLLQGQSSELINYLPRDYDVDSLIRFGKKVSMTGKDGYIDVMNILSNLVAGRSQNLPPPSVFIEKAAEFVERNRLGNFNHSLFSAKLYQLRHSGEYPNLTPGIVETELSIKHDALHQQNVYNEGAEIALKKIPKRVTSSNLQAERAKNIKIVPPPETGAADAYRAWNAIIGTVTAAGEHVWAAVARSVLKPYILVSCVYHNRKPTELVQDSRSIVGGAVLTIPLNVMSQLFPEPFKKACELLNVMTTSTLPLVAAASPILQYPLLPPSDHPDLFGAYSAVLTSMMGQDNKKGVYQAYVDKVTGKDQEFIIRQIKSYDNAFIQAYYEAVRERRKRSAENRPTPEALLHDYADRLFKIPYETFKESIAVGTVDSLVIDWTMGKPTGLGYSAVAHYQADESGTLEPRMRPNAFKRIRKED